MKKLFIWLTGLLVLFSGINTSFALIQIYTPRTEGNDISRNQTTYSKEGSDSKESLLSRISFINRYLWLSIGILCFIFLIWNGFQMIYGSSDTKSKSLNSLIGSIVGIVICLLSYALVNLLVNLFGG